MPALLLVLHSSPALQSSAPFQCTCSIPVLHLAFYPACIPIYSSTIYVYSSQVLQFNVLFSTPIQCSVPVCAPFQYVLHSSAPFQCFCSSQAIQSNTPVQCMWHGIYEVATIDKFHCISYNDKIEGTCRILGHPITYSFKNE